MIEYVHYFGADMGMEGTVIEFGIEGATLEAAISEFR